MLDPFAPADRERQYLRELDVRRVSYESALQRATPELQQRLIGITRTFPNLSAGGVQGGAAAGLSDEEIAPIAARDDGGMNWFERSVASAASWAASPFRGAYEQAIKPLVRGAFLVMDTAAQELVQRPLTSAFAAASDSGRSVADAYREYGNSEGVVAFNKLRNTWAQDGAGAAWDQLNTQDKEGTERDESFLGTGFFAGGQVAEESYNQRTLTIQGQRANLGRALPTSQVLGAAGQQLSGIEGDGFGASMAQNIGEFISPGGTAHDVVTGISQFAADVFLDPAALATGGSAALAKGARATKLTRSGSAVDEFIEGGVTGMRAKARRYNQGEASNLARELAEEAGGAAEV